MTSAAQHHNESLSRSDIDNDTRKTGYLIATWRIDQGNTALLVTRSSITNMGGWEWGWHLGRFVPSPRARARTGSQAGAKTKETPESQGKTKPTDVVIVATV